MTMSNEYILKVLKNTINELEQKIAEFPADPSYLQILFQIQFINECLIFNKDIKIEKGDRVLNFPIIASRSLTDINDKNLIKNIDEILSYISSI